MRHPTLTVVYTAVTPERLVADMPLADPVQQWWDLLDLGGEDRREAADRLRDAILQHSIPGTR